MVSLTRRELTRETLALVKFRGLIMARVMLDSLYTSMRRSAASKDQKMKGSVVRVDLGFLILVISKFRGPSARPYALSMKGPVSLII